MKAVIAEKPSVAREIALLLGAIHKDEGCFTGNGFIVTWALGHLVNLGMPEDYGISRFQRNTLPILPNPFLLTVRKIKKDKTYKTDIRASKQLAVINEVLNRSESIIVATDAGREGELIFRYIYKYLKCTKPFERLWISSLTEKALRKGFENLKPGNEFDGLFLAAEARSRADWLVGINASQALSLAVGSGIYSLGRVQTPALALVCRRYMENKKFTPQNYWQIELEHQKEFVNFKSLSKTKWDDKKTAGAAFKSVQKNTAAVITAVEIKNSNEQPPLLFDLIGLQKQANKKLNFSAEQTLEIAQSLYEKKLITYPRTGSRYIPEDIWFEIPNMIRTLEIWPCCKESIFKLKLGRLNKHIVDDLKVTDHHGLLITDKIPSVLSVKEKSIYNMIAFRLLEAVSPVCVKQVTDVSLEVLHYDFSLKGCRILEPGWRAVKGSFFEDSGENFQDLPELSAGIELKIKNALLLEKKTQAPILYTEAGLLSAMENAGKEIENKEGKRMLQKIGIGTPATRAAIIETLFCRNYILREHKSLIPTSKGLQVYELVKDKKIADPVMTVEWETAFVTIENNSTDPGIFEKEIGEYTAVVVQEILESAPDPVEHTDLLCPKCKNSILVIKDSIVKCPDESCRWVQFRNICGVQLSISDIRNLVEQGKSPLIRAMKSRSGKLFDAFVLLDQNYKSSFEFEKRAAKK